MDIIRDTWSFSGKLIFPKDLIKAKLIEKGLANEKGKPKFNGKLIHFCIHLMYTR